ncbi:MAG: hypothetical protein OEU54_12245 [Gemmatimonadota bacterium]|nr:hypothetical protein [Gemmatimonadota bacterium]
MPDNQPDEERRPPPTDAQIRAAFMAFASMIRRFDAEGQLIRRLPLLMGKLGDLRHMAFEYEVRVTERLVPQDRAQADSGQEGSEDEKGRQDQ